jgi:hypothetical protein
MSYFKAPTNKGDAPGFTQYFIFLTDLGLDRLYNADGFCLYEFDEQGQRVRVVSSTIDMRGSVSYYDPRA